jgi:steroid delta-isomerase-like uncharacterized protein
MGANAMTATEPEVLAHRWHMDLYVKGDLRAAEDFVSPDCVIHLFGREYAGVDGARGLAELIRTAFPDVRITHHEAIVEDDRVAIRWTGEGTHRGDYLGVPPTGKPIRIDGIDVMHLHDDMITEVWISYDNYAVLKTMGAIPAG